MKKFTSYIIEIIIEILATAILLILGVSIARGLGYKLNSPDDVDTALFIGAIALLASFAVLITVKSVFARLRGNVPKAKPICHKDFSATPPINVYGKEKDTKPRKEEDGRFLNRHILFRRKLKLDSIADAILRISADDYYKLYVNGRFVTSGPAASYPEAYNYNEINVTDYLQKGVNTFAVHTYYQGLANRVWVSADRRSMMCFELSVGGEVVLVSDESWRCREHTGYKACGIVGYDTAFMECYDSAAPEVNFYLENFDDSAWEQASVCEYADYTLVPQSTSNLIYYTAEPKVIRRTEAGYFLDFGQEMVGYITARAVGKRGDVITLRYGEELSCDGSVRYDMRCNCLYEEKWILSGGYDTLEQFDYKAIRYAEISVPEGVTVEDIKMLVRHYPYEDNSELDTDGDERLFRIAELCKSTVKYGTQENYVDCPTREKGQYLGDVAIAGRAQAIITGKADLMKKAITDFINTAFICKGLMAVSGAGLMQEYLDYSLQLPGLINWVYSFDGDLDFVKGCRGAVDGMLEYMLRFVREDGLFANVDKRNLVDWPKNLRDGYTIPEEEVPHNVANAFFIGFLSDIEKFYGILGKNASTVTKYKELVTKAYVDAFYSASDKLFYDDLEHTHASVHSNILALKFNIGTEDKALVENIVSLIKTKRLTSVGVYVAYYALAALKEHGYYEAAKELMLDEGCWLNMLSEGATTTFEAWGKEQKWNTSLFHPWACAPIIILSKNTKVY